RCANKRCARTWRCCAPGIVPWPWSACRERALWFHPQTDLSEGDAAMFLASLFANLRRKAKRPRNRPQPWPAYRWQPLGLHVEALEDRMVLSTLTVLNNADSGAGSLRAVLGSASDGDTIVFDHHLAGQTISLTTGPLAVNKNVSIMGL